MLLALRLVYQDSQGRLVLHFACKAFGLLVKIQKPETHLHIMLYNKYCIKDKTHVGQSELDRIASNTGPASLQSRVNK